MVADNIKKFLKQKINKESNSDILDELYKELYKISKTQEDYSFLFDKLIEKGSEEHNYSSLKLLCIISIKLSKEQEAYDQILEYSKNSLVTITQTVWLPTSISFVLQQPSLKKPVIGFSLHISKSVPSTFFCFMMLLKFIEIVIYRCLPFL